MFKGLSRLREIRDAYKIALTKGYTYRLELKGLDGEDELIDPHLVLRDKNGIYLDQRDGSDRQGVTLDFAPTATGVYIAQVASYGDEPVGQYELSLNLTEATHDDVQGSPYTTAMLESDNTSVTGSIDYIGDRDFYKVRLEDGRSYEVIVEVEDPIVDDVQLRLWIYPSTCGGRCFKVKSMGSGRWFGVPTPAVIPRPGDDIYLLEVGGDKEIGWPGWWMQTGPYTLTINRY